jgi:hypothetical protein
MIDSFAQQTPSTLSRSIPDRGRISLDATLVYQTVEVTTRNMYWAISTTLPLEILTINRMEEMVNEPSYGRGRRLNFGSITSVTIKCTVNEGAKAQRIRYDPGNTVPTNLLRWSGMRQTLS